MSTLKLQYDAVDRVNIFFRWGYFSEKRDNGKASTIDGTEEANDTMWKTASGGGTIQWPDGSELEARLFGEVETFRSNFLAVPVVTPPRSVGRMTLNQTVPTEDRWMLQWSKLFGAHIT